MNVLRFQIHWYESMEILAEAREPRAPLAKDIHCGLGKGLVKPLTKSKDDFYRPVLNVTILKGNSDNYKKSIVILSTPIIIRVCTKKKLFRD